MSELEPTDHIKRMVQNDDPVNLSKREAKEQLLHENRGLNGAHFEVEQYPDWEVGDGVVTINVGGTEQDHYIYHDDTGEGDE